MTRIRAEIIAGLFALTPIALCLLVTIWAVKAVKKAESEAQRCAVVGVK